MSIMIKLGQFLRNSGMDRRRKTWKKILLIFMKSLKPYPKLFEALNTTKIGQNLVKISFTWLGNRVYCSMCVMCVLSSPKPLPSWGSLFHGFPDRNQNKDSTFKNIQYTFLTHKNAKFFRQIDLSYNFCSKLVIIKC